MIKKNGYTITWGYAGMTYYCAEKDGAEIYFGYSVDELIKRIGFDPFED